MRWLAAILIFVSLTAQAQERKFWAVIMGVSKFQNLDAAQQLQYADKDAEAFSKFIQSPRGREFPKDNVKLLTNTEATKASLQISLASWLKRNAKEEDIIYIFIATHGMVDKEEPRRTYLLTTDADPEDLYDTTMSITNLGEIITSRLKKAGRIVLFADACRSGKLGTGISGDLKSSASQNQEIVGILASRAKELSQEGSQFCKGHGAFSCYLLKGLAGEADADKDNTVTAGELITFVRDQVAKATKGDQTPQEFGEFDARLPMSYPDKPTADLGLAWIINPFARLKEMFASLAGGMNLAAAYMRYDFEQAVAQGNLLSPKTQSAWDQYQRMVSQNVPAGELADFKDELAVALEDEGQKVVQRYLRGDASPLSARDYQAGAEYFTRAAELNPDEPKLKAKARFCAGRALLSENRLRESEAALKESVAIDSNGAYSHNALGLAYTRYRRYDEAIKEFQAAFDRASRWAYPHYNLAIAYVEMKRYREAEAEYKQAIALGPNYAYIYLNLAELYFKYLNLQPDAINNLKRAIDLKPDDAKTYQMLGNIYQKRGENGNAETSFRTAVKLQPTEIDHRLNLAEFLVEYAGKPSEGEEILRTIVQDFPQNARGHGRLGTLLLERGKLEDAEAEFIFAATIAPNDAGVVESLGDLHVKQKRYQEAAGEYRQALQLVGNDPVERAKIDKKLKAAERQK